MNSSRRDPEPANMAGAGMVAGASCTTHDEASQMQQSLDSAQAALQSSSIPAQLFGTEMLLDVAKNAAGKSLIVSAGTLAVLCDGMADGRIKGQAFADGLKVFETVAVGCPASCESGQACGMPSACVDVMLCIFSTNTQPHEHRLQAGRVTASLLNSHKCQRTALREGSGLDSLATQMRGSKEDKALILQSLEILSRAVRNDGYCKSAIAQRVEMLQSVAQLLAYEHMAPPALNAVVALLCCGPGMHVLSRECCSALCQAGIAPPLIGLLASEPDSTRCTEVLEIARRLASSGPEGLAALRDAGLLEACLFIIESAEPGSHNAKCAVNLVGRSAEWDDCSRRLLVEKNAHLTLLQALQIADFEELPLKHDICEVLSKLGASDPDTSSTGGKLLLHWSAQFGDAQMCGRYLRSFPLVDPQDERGNTPLHLAVCNDRRDAVELLLGMNASITITNKSRQTPPNLATPQSDVWDLLREEAEWRSLLEMHRPCRVKLVGWEGPSECTFCPTLGVLRLRGLGDHLKASVPQMRRLLRPRKTRQSGYLVVSVPLPHTAVISQPRALEVHINFNGLDHVLGQTLVPSSSDGRVTVVGLWLCTDSSAEADGVERALKRLQLRIYPDIIALSGAYLAYSQMYEQCKAEQIHACTQYSKMHLALQEGHATPQLGQQLEELGEEVEQGRNAVLVAHRELLDMADDAIARLTLTRVECEKAAWSAGGDALWEPLGDRALAMLHLVRAYHERSLHAAYSGLLPPQPHHSSEDSEGPAGADSMDQLLSGAGVSANTAPLISTDKELIIAAKALSAECKEALSHSQAQASNSRLSVHTAVCAAPVDLWSTGNSRAAPSEEQQGCSSCRTRVEEAQLPGAVPCGDSERGLMAPTPPQKAQRRPRRSGSSGSPSEDNLSMTGLMNSGSEGASIRSSKGSKTSSADTEVSLDSSSDDSEKALRHVERFLRAAAHFATAAMATYESETYDSEPDDFEPVLPVPALGKSGKSTAARRLSTDMPSEEESQLATAMLSSADEQPLQKAANAVEQIRTPEACRSPQADLGMVAEEPCRVFERQPLRDAQKEWRRSGSFTFPRTPPRTSSGHSEEFSFRRATASEPCEAVGFPRLPRQHPSPLSHHASLAKMASTDSREGDEELPAAEEVRRLLETGASYDWKADPMDVNMAQVLTHEVDARGPGGGGIAELTALLTPDNWETPLGTSAQAAPARHSSAMAPALAADPPLGRPPLPDSQPRQPKPAPSAMPPPLDTGTSRGLAPGQDHPTRPQTPSPLHSGNVSGQSVDAELAAEHALPDTAAQESRSLAGAPSQEGGETAGRSGIEPARMPMTEEGKVEFVKILTARIAEAAQQVALGAISSSVTVAGEAVRDAPSWAGPDVIIATTMDKLDGIVAAAHAQLASAIESGVAQAAALASTMSADDLANKWHERKQRALPPSPAITPRSPTGRMSGSPSAAKGPISARFPSFAEHGRKALADAQTPTGASDALDSSANKDLHATAESASLAQRRPADTSTEEEPSVAAEPVTKDVVMAEPGSLADVEAESDASSFSKDARLQSPAKKAKQIFPGPQTPSVPNLALTKTQDLLPLVMDPFGQAATAAMAMQEGAFGAGICNSTGSVDKVSPRRRKERSRPPIGRSRQVSAGDSFSALSTGASSISSGHLASAGQQFESFLLDSNCSGLSQ